MSKVTRTKKMGRPRIDPQSTADFHLGLRFPATMRDRMRYVVEALNQRQRSLGLPANLTASSLARGWIEERLELTLAQLSQKSPEHGPPPQLKSVWDWIRENPYKRSE